MSKPYNFKFAQAIFLLHRFRPYTNSLGKGSNPLKETVFLKSRIFFSAPPSDLYKIQEPWGKWGGQLRGNIRRKPKPFMWHTAVTEKLLTYDKIWEAKEPLSKKPLKVIEGPLEAQINFMGIAGVQGPLPLVYTEMIFDRLRIRDTATRDFLDIFNHRVLSIFYRIEQKLYPALQTIKRRDETPIGKQLSSLLGIGNTKYADFPLRHLLSYARFFWKKPHSPEMLKAMLRDYFNTPVAVVPFQGRWFKLDHDKQTRLGSKKAQNTVLGRNAVVGNRVWCQDQSFAVCLIIRTPEEYLQMLPTGESYPILKKLIANYVGPRFQVNIGLKLIHKPSSRLGAKQAFPFRLGWTSWLLRNTSFTDIPWVMVSEPPENKSSCA